MDDYSLQSLQDSRNEWCARLINILYPLITEGIQSIFSEALKVCVVNDEQEKYLATFQTFLGKIPGWNPTMISDETKRILDKSGCSYLADLVTCIHVVQLKALSCVRVGTQQKKVDVNVPSLEEFIHRVYVHAARKIYANVYLFEKGVPSLQIQKYNRELELIIKECILTAVRDSIPMEEILRAYMEETQENDTVVEEKEEVVSEQVIDDTPADQVMVNDQPDASTEESGLSQSEQGPISSVGVSNDESEVISVKTEEVPTEEKEEATLRFSDNDSVQYSGGDVDIVSAPKTLERLAELEAARVDEAEVGSDEQNASLNVGDEIDLDPLAFEELT